MSKQKKMIKEYITPEAVKDSLANLSKLTFEVTDACNLMCEYCGYGKLYNNYDKRIEKNLSVEKVKRLIDHLADSWSSKYNIAIDKKVFVGFYGGEPLLNMALVKEVIGYIEEKHIPNRSFIYSMTTNGMLLDRYMDYLVEHEVDLLISLDGNEKNNSYRVNKAGKSVFHILTRNIAALKEKYPDYFERKVNFNAVLHDRNSVGEIYSYIQTVYGKVPGIGELNTVGVNPEKKEKFKLMQQSFYKSLLESDNYKEIQDKMNFESPFIKEVTNYIFEHGDFVYQDYFDLRYGKPKKKIPTGTCIPFVKGLFLTVNGKVLPCEHIGQQHPLGWVSDTEVHIEEQEIADLYNAYFDKVEKQCGGCRLYESCAQCIFNLDDLDGAAICQNKTSPKQFREYTQFVYSFLRKNPETYYKIMKEIILS